MSNQDSKFSRKAFAKNLKRLMDKNHLRSIDLAKKLGLSKGAISNYTSGDSVPRTDMVSKISEIFGVHIEELFQENFKQKKIPQSQIRIKSKVSPVFLHEDDPSEISYYQVPMFINKLYTSDIIYVDYNYCDRILSTFPFCGDFECYAVRVRENCLTKSGISKGTVAIFAATKETKNGDFAAILYKEELNICVRRVRYKDDKIIISTDNDKEEYKINARNCPIAVLGKVVTTLNSYK